MSENKTVEPITHDTFVIGGNKGRIVFIKGYEYAKQKEEAQSDLALVEKTYEFWFISHVGNWILTPKTNDEPPMPISIPFERINTEI